MSETPADETGTPAPAMPRVRRRLRSAQDVRGRWRRVTTWSLSVVLFVLLVNALVGENGYLAAMRARREHTELLANLAHLRLENQALQRESRRLQHDPAALEETARRDLGLMKPGETLIIIRNAAPASPAAR